MALFDILGPCSVWLGLVSYFGFLGVFFAGALSSNCKFYFVMSSHVRAATEGPGAARQ